MAHSQMPDEERIDEINLTVGDVDENTQTAILEKRAAIDPSVGNERPPAVEATA